MTAGAEFESKLGRISVGLRSDLVVTRQTLGGKPRYVFHDPVTFQNHAFTAVEYRIITSVVPQRMLAEVFAHLVANDVLDEEEKEAFYKFVLGLHASSLLRLPICQPELMFKRYRHRKRTRLVGLLSSPLYFKVPVWNPDRFLTRTLRYVGWLFSRSGLALWALLMLAVLWKCAGRLDEMFGQTAGLLSLSNLPIMWISLVMLKAIHEFGHAYTCRRLGGEVPEMGLVLIVMTPCAYVDASGSWKFPSRLHRVAVALGGIYVESIVAGIAALVWAATQPGLLHDVALNVIVLASVVTVLFNLNPLIKFDGYFVFSDILGVVNLKERASRFLQGWAKHLALGFPRPEHDYSSREKLLYSLYGPAAFVYRLTLALTLTSMIVLSWPGAGMVLGGVFIWALMITPIKQVFTYLLLSEETRPVRARAQAIAVASVVVVPFGIASVPISQSVVAPALLDPGVRTSVRAPVSGFVRAVGVRNGEDVQLGDRLCELHSPALELQRARYVGEMEAESVRLDTIELDDPTHAASLRSRLAFLRARVTDIDRRLASVSVGSANDGTVVEAKPVVVPGQYMHEGQELFQIHSDHQFLRVVLTDYDFARAHLEVGSVAEVRFTCQPYEPTTATVHEILRSSSRHDLPIELTMIAGGELYARPIGNDEASADQPYLHVFLRVESIPMEARGAGLTAKVRLAAEAESIGAWLKRAVLNLANAWKMS